MQHDKFTNKITFSMTISNAQSQTLKSAEMYGPSYIFLHDQLCVAFSESPSLDKVALAVIEGRRQRIGNVRFIVGKKCISRSA